MYLHGTWLKSQYRNGVFMKQTKKLTRRMMKRLEREGKSVKDYRFVRDIGDAWLLLNISTDAYYTLMKE